LSVEIDAPGARATAKPCNRIRVFMVLLRRRGLDADDRRAQFNL
jgi:hypothetical protein